MQESASGRAIAALVVGILSFLICGGLLGPVAWYVGAAELRAIRDGQSSAAGYTVALIGMICGIVQTVLLCVGLLSVLVWLFFFGGLAMLGIVAGMSGAGG